MTVFILTKLSINLRIKNNTSVITFLLNMQRFGAILLFYRPYFLWSIGVNIALLIVSPAIPPILISKLFLTAFLWYVVSETRAKRKLIFYNNLGISSLKLFSTIFLIDIFITLGFLLLVKEFI